MIKFSCPKCGKHYHINDTLAGKKGKCSDCGLEFSVPATGTIPAEAPAPTTAQPQDAPALNSRSKMPAQMQPNENPYATKARPPATPSPAQSLAPSITQPIQRKCPAGLILYRVMCGLVLAIWLLVLCIGIGLLLARRPLPPSYGSGPGSAIRISYHSSEQERAPLYVVLGATVPIPFIISFFLSFFLRKSRGAYIYHTIMIFLAMIAPPGLLTVFGVITLIWWFRGNTKEHFFVAAREMNGAY